MTLLLGTGFLHINGVLETCYITKSYQFSLWMKYNLDNFYFFLLPYNTNPHQGVQLHLYTWFRSKKSKIYIVRCITFFLPETTTFKKLLHFKSQKLMQYNIKNIINRITFWGIKLVNTWTIQWCFLIYLNNLVFYSRLCERYFKIYHSRVHC